MSTLGYHAFLVGERLIAQADPGRSALRGVSGVNDAARVKICGVRRLEDALLAAELGADAVGFVFWPQQSAVRRSVQGARHREASCRRCLTTVGVFVDQPADSVDGGGRPAGARCDPVARTRSTVRLRAQLRIAVIKAVAVGDSFDRRRDLDAVPSHVTVLLDAHDPIKRGGTGTADRLDGRGGRRAPAPRDPVGRLDAGERRDRR